jgi:CRP-like cAMP-binding protein
MWADTAPVDELLQPFFRKILLRDALGAEEQRAICEAADQRLSFSPGQDLVTEGDRPIRSMLVAGGFTCRYRTLSDGARQLTAIHLPGDFVELHSFLLKEMDHSVGALTKCQIITFPHERLVRVTERFPHLTRLLWLLTLLDGAIHREWLVGMGQLSAQQRTAHLICEIYTRLKTIGMATSQSFEFPITQAALADAVGISAVHINRVLQELRHRNLITWDGGLLEIRDWDAFAAAGEFDDRYLHLIQEPR